MRGIVVGTGQVKLLPGFRGVVGRRSRQRAGRANHAAEQVAVSKHQPKAEHPRPAVRVHHGPRFIHAILLLELFGQVLDELRLVGRPPGQVFRLGGQQDDSPFLAVRLPRLQDRRLHRVSGRMQPDQQRRFVVGVVVLGDERPVFMVVSLALRGEPTQLQVRVGQI